MYVMYFYININTRTPIFDILGMIIYNLAKSYDEVFQAVGSQHQCVQAWRLVLSAWKNLIILLPYDLVSL